MKGHRHACECGWRARAASTDNGDAARKMVHAAYHAGILRRKGMQSLIARETGVTRQRISQMAQEMRDGQQATG